jgi:hypothetical protein
MLLDMRVAGVGDKTWSIPGKADVDGVMNRGGGTRNPKTRDRGNLMLPCHTLSHPQVTHDKSCNMSH